MRVLFQQAVEDEDEQSLQTIGYDEQVVEHHTGAPYCEEGEAPREAQQHHDAGRSAQAQHKVSATRLTQFVEAHLPQLVDDQREHDAVDEQKEAGGRQNGNEEGRVTQPASVID